MSNSELPDVRAVISVLEQVAQHGIPGHGDPSLLDVGTQDFCEYFGREVLDDLIVHGGATCRFFEGDYGAGKTHLLRMLREQGRRRGAATVYVELSGGLRLEDWSLVVKSIVQNLELDLAGERLRGLPDILAGLSEQNGTTPDRLKTALLPHAGFRNAMHQYFCDADAPDPLADFLFGEKIRVSELKRAGVKGVKDPLSERNAELVLATVLGGLFHLGVPGTILLFDENEKTFDVNSRVVPKGVRVAANRMRRLIDASTTGRLIGTVAVFAVLPGFLDNAARCYQALGQRLEMVRRTEQEPAWRWPVLPVDAVGSEQSREWFLERVADQMERLVAHCGADTTGLASRLRTEGHEVLQLQAGSGYRRELMKRLATVAVARI